MFDRNPESNCPSKVESGKQVDLTKTLYGELRKLASFKMSNQAGYQTLQATALVHEAWLKLGGENQSKWEDRAHFISAVAMAMRQILVDRARKRQTLRHGGGQKRVDLEALNEEGMDVSKIAEKDEILLLVDELLKELTEADSLLGQLVQVRYFGGLTLSETASTLNMSERTVQRRLTFAKAWLNSRLTGRETEA